MKQKLDFVTNSSSTAFCIWGMTLSYGFDDFPEKIKKIAYDMYVQSTTKFSPTFVSYEEFLEDPAGYDAYWNLEEFFSKIDLAFMWYPELEGLYIGIAPHQMDKNKTIQEGLDETKKKFEEHGFEIKDFKYILEVMYG